MTYPEKLVLNLNVLSERDAIRQARRYAKMWFPVNTLPYIKLATLADDNYLVVLSLDKELCITALNDELLKCKKKTDSYEPIQNVTQKIINENFPSQTIDAPFVSNRVFGLFGILLCALCVLSFYAQQTEQELLQAELEQCRYSEK